MAIFHTIDQRSPEWRKLRCGVPTASRFGEIVTPKGEMRDGETIKKYMTELIAERIIGTPIEKWQSEWMKRGTELESFALSGFAHDHKVEVGPGGFVTTDDGKFGCSPDGVIAKIVGANQLEGVEIKCPAPQTHVYYMIYGLGDSYVQQVQGQLWITGWDAMHFYSWHPDLPPFHVETKRDEAFIKRLAGHLKSFHEELVERTMEVREALDRYQQQARTEPVKDDMPF